MASALIDALCLRVAPAAIFAPILLVMCGLVGGAGKVLVVGRGTS